MLISIADKGLHVDRHNERIRQSQIQIEQYTLVEPATGVTEDGLLIGMITVVPIAVLHLQRAVSVEIDPSLALEGP